MRNKDKILCLDLDDVCFDFTKHLVLEYYKFTGIKEPSPKVWTLSDNLQAFLDKQSQKNDFYLNIPVKEGAVEFINLAKAKGINIVYLTARPEAFDENTSTALCRNGIYREIIYSTNKTKSLLQLQKHYDLILFVDDRASTVKSTSEAGINTFLMDSSHNQEYDYSKRIRSLMELKEYLK